MLLLITWGWIHRISGRPQTYWIRICMLTMTGVSNVCESFRSTDLSYREAKSLLCSAQSEKNANLPNLSSGVLRAGYACASCKNSFLYSAWSSSPLMPQAQFIAPVGKLLPKTGNMLRSTVVYNSPRHLNRNLFPNIFFRLKNFSCK